MFRDTCYMLLWTKFAALVLMAKYGKTVHDEALFLLNIHAL